MINEHLPATVTAEPQLARIPALPSGWQTAAPPAEPRTVDTAHDEDELAIRAHLAALGVAPAGW
ncbi:hypothetical protein ACODT5_28630 [Streptomyces sp. 5.8]|uniref:hypothetical protein n=1 Tax=Streptomyces sp. 5.8 TaxID=3406571 RepID=UPI003BB7DA77